MTDLRKAAQMALDWRDKNSELLFELGGWDFIFEINNWSQSLRGALAQPQREWQGLKDEEVTGVWDSIIKYAPSEVRLNDFARAIEAKLKEKNSG